MNVYFKMKYDILFKNLYHFVSNLQKINELSGSPLNETEITFLKTMKKDYTW